MPFAHTILFCRSFFTQLILHSACCLSCAAIDINHEAEPIQEVVETVRVVCQLVAMLGSNDSMLVR